MLHEKIKTSTTIDHKNAEKHSYGHEIMSRSLTKEQYAQLLVANYTYIAAWEKQWAQLSNMDTTQFDLTSRSKTTLLENDLKSMGVDPSNSILIDLETPSTLAQFVGRMYVIEGSTLGGAMIEKQLQLNPNLNDCSFEFYGGYGPNLIPFWKSFLAELNKIENEDDQNEAVLWAKRSFNDMETCFINAKSMSLHS